MGKNIFRFWLRIRRVIRILENLTPRGIIPWQVRLPVVSYPGKSNLPGYHTPASQSPRGIIPWGVNKKFRQNMTPRGIIPPRVSLFYTKVRITQEKNHNQNRKYLNTLISGPCWFE